MTGGQIAVVGEGVSCMGSISEYSSAGCPNPQGGVCDCLPSMGSQEQELVEDSCLCYEPPVWLYGIGGVRKCQVSFWLFFPPHPSQVTLFCKSVSVCFMQSP